MNSKRARLQNLVNDVSDGVHPVHSVDVDSGARLDIQVESRYFADDKFVILQN